MPGDDELSSYQGRAEEVLAGIEFGAKHLLTVTDAEILALDGPDAKRVTPTLSLAEPVSAQQRGLAIDEAAKRMFANGTIDDGTPLGGADSEAPEPTVRTVLRMRRSWLAVLLIDQQTALGRQWVTVYLRADGRALIEAALPDGRHNFSAMKRAAALDAAAKDLTPIPEAADEDGDGVVHSADAWQEEAGPMLSEAKIVNVVISKRHDRTRRRLTDRRLGLYNFADRTEVLWAEEPTHVRIAPISRRTLRERLGQMTRPLPPDDAHRNA